MPEQLVQEQAQAGVVAFPILMALDRILRRLTQACAAILVAMEVIILSAGVFSRYILGRPLIWSDELALILFLWLAMLGSVVALSRGEHMRLSFVVGRFSPAWQRRVDGLMLCGMIGLLLIILPASIRYSQLQFSEITPALRIPVFYRVVSISAAFSLLAITLMTRLLANYTWKEMIGLSVCAALFGAVLWLGKPLLDAMGDYNLIFFFIGLVLIFVLLGMPIGFVFGVVTVAFLLVMTRAPLTIVMNRMDGGISDLILLSIPLFIFLGLLIEETGLARALIEFMVAILGHVRGGLHYVLLCGMYLVSGISGSKSADMAAIAPILLPEMKRRGVKEGELISLLSASGAMAETIPPSIILISIGVVTGISIADLFNGGLVPAAVGAVALAIVVFFRTRSEVVPTVVRASPVTIFKAFFVALPALALPFLIRGAVVNGIATATEVATVGVIYSLVCGIIFYRRFPGRNLYSMCIRTASLSGALLFIIGLANAMAWALTQSGFADLVGQTMGNVPYGQVGFLTVSVVVFAVLGSILEGFPAIVLIGPLLFPIAVELGIHPVQYAMVAVLSMSLGLFSPPFGVGFYAACVVGNVNPDKAMRDIWIYMGALLIAVVVIASFPWLSIGFL